MRALPPYYEQEITSYHHKENRWNRRKEFINMLTENSYLQLSNAYEHDTSYPNTPAFGTHSLTHLLTYSLTYLLAYSLTH